MVYINSMKVLYIISLQTTSSSFLMRQFEIISYRAVNSSLTELLAKRKTVDLVMFIRSIFSFYYNNSAANDLR